MPWSHELRRQKFPPFLQPVSSLTETFCVDCSCAPIWQPSPALASWRGSSPVWPSSIKTDTWTAGEPDVEESRIKRNCAFTTKITGKQHWLVQHGYRSKGALKLFSWYDFLLCFCRFWFFGSRIKAQKLLKHWNDPKFGEYFRYALLIQIKWILDK